MTTSPMWSSPMIKRLLQTATAITADVHYYTAAAAAQ
jgi:hypothetical protein